MRQSRDGRVALLTREGEARVRASRNPGVARFAIQNAPLRELCETAHAERRSHQMQRTWRRRIRRTGDVARITPKSAILALTQRSAAS